MPPRQPQRQRRNRVTAGSKTTLSGTGDELRGRLSEDEMTTLDGGGGGWVDPRAIALL